MSAATVVESAPNLGSRSTAQEAIAGVSLKGRRIIVTGASSGLGIETARVLARAGGPEVLGSYAMAIQTAQLVSILAVVGCDQLVLREVAAHLRLGDKAKADKDFQTAKVIDAAIDYKMVELGLTR